MTKKKALVVPPAMPFLPPVTPTPDAPTPDAPTPEVPKITRKLQLCAANLRDMLTLPEGHEGREEQVARFSKLLEEQGVASPPKTVDEAIELINQVGEFNG